MTDKAFIVMQIGAKDSPERKRADEIYNYVVAPPIKQAGLEPYRADLDPSPGAITPKFLSELLNARLIIADLTGRNPNVFYELGIAHSFARPLISIADSSSSIPFDTKDERIIELGEYQATGLTYVQGEQAKAALQESLAVVLSDDYVTPSPLREVAANRSVDELAPKDPVAAEMAQIRETLDEIRKNFNSHKVVSSSSVNEDTRALQRAIERNLAFLSAEDFNLLIAKGTSSSHRAWVAEMVKRWNEDRRKDIWANEEPSAYSDEPPF